MSGAKSEMGNLIFTKLIWMFVDALVFGYLLNVGLPIAQAEMESNNLSVDLLSRYPTTLVTEDTHPERAREWEFSAKDIYSISGFSLSIGNSLTADIGKADVGLGYCIDGAVWAVIIPREKGTIKWTQNNETEAIAYLWLRFHPAEINRLFPMDTVKGAGNEKLWARMQKIANHRIFGSWQAGGRAMIPGRKDLTFDADTIGGKRRFFVVDTKANTATYEGAFESRTIPEDKPFNKKDAETSFDKLWEEYDHSYAMFVIRPEVDWDKLREQYRPKAIECTTAYEFALVCSEMLKNLRDLHIWITVDGQNVPVFNRPRERNANPLAFERMIGTLNKAGKNIMWGKTAEKIGFISINSWKKDVDKNFDEVLENMRDTRGLVIDVRLNGGGDEPTAGKVAGRFANKEYIYAYSQYRTGPKHTDLTERYPRSVIPGGPWRYDRPVVVLMGQICMSSNESFVSMMAQCPQVTTMGDHTCGSSGNPKFVELSGGVRISLPQWIDLLQDGTPLDERGVKPDVNFPTKPEFFEGNRDDLLSAAVERLKKEPLPKEPIAGKSIQAVKAERDANIPKVVSVWPMDRAVDVDPNTEIRIRFDRPMNPTLLDISWKVGRCVKYKDFKYDDTKSEFVILTKLEDDCEHTISIESDRFPGFRAKSGQSMTHAFEWSFKTKKINQPLGSAKPKLISVTPASGSELPLLALLQMKFDIQMDANNSKIYSVTHQNWLTGYQVLSRQVDYDAENKTFLVPVVLPSDWKGTMELTGFVSSVGAKAEPVKLEYSSGQQLISQVISDRLEKASCSKKLFSIMENIKKDRGQIQSLSETVLCAISSNYRIYSYSCIFKVKDNKCLYADISNVMHNPFLIGSDGKECWFYYGNDKPTKKLVVALYDEIGEKTISLSDPFNLITLDVNTAIKKFKPEYVGSATFGGRQYHLIRTWSVEKHGDKRRSFIQCNVNRWWIDAEKFQVLKVEYDFGNNESTSTFLYDQNIPSDSEFACPKIAGIEPEKPEPLEEGYDTRLIRIIDGSSDGRTTVRWGKRGPAGMFSSGMN